MKSLYYVTKRRFKPTEGEISNMASKTIPNETMTIRQILDRYQKTGHIERKPLVYLDEQLEAISRYNNPGALDYTDLDELNEKVQILQESIQQAKEEQKRQIENEKTNNTTTTQDDKKEPDRGNSNE